MKASIDLGLSVLCSDEFRREHGPVYSYEAMADACDCSHDAVRNLGERALAKMKRGLRQQGIGEVEALMALEMMARQGCYRSQHEDCRPLVCPTR